MRDALLAALRVFDDGTLEALANKGLVRRAAKDLEAGKAVVATMAADKATLTVDGETVEIDAKGPAKATCTCPAKDVCRHRIAAVMALRSIGAVAAAGPPETAAPIVRDMPVPQPTAGLEPARASPPADPLAELLALDLGTIVKWAGKASLRAALELITTGPPVVQPDGAALVVKLEGNQPDVRFLAGQGLDGMVSKATPARRKALHTAAVLAVRRVHGLATELEPGPGTPPAQVAEPAAPARRDPGFHTAVRGALEDAARTGLNQAPLALEERLFELSVSSRADRLPRLASALRNISSLVRDKRSHAFTLVPAAMLNAIASAYALNDALDRDTVEDSLASLEGDVRQQYRPVQQLTLHGLGANLWRTPSGARGVTGYFHARELGRIVSVSHARGSAYDASFDPEQAFLNDRVWGAAPLHILLRSTVTLTSASVSDGGRLSQAGETRATHVPALRPHADALTWHVTSSDWIGLQQALQQRFNGSLNDGDFGAPLLLAPSHHARATFDAMLQEYTWPVADSNGRWIGLTLRHGEVDEMTAARLQRMSTIGEVALVLVLPRPEADRFVLTPIAVIAATPSEPRMRLYDLQFGSKGYELPSASMRRDWLVQLAKRSTTTADRPSGVLGTHAEAPLQSAGAPPIDATFIRTTPSSTTRRSLTAAADALLTIAEIGGRPLDETQERTIATLADRFERIGLPALAAALTIVSGEGARRNSSLVLALPATAAVKGPSTSALLRAVHLIDRTLILCRALPWLAA